MKKFLSLLGSVAIMSSTVATVVACGTNDERFHKNPDYNPEETVQSEQTKQLITEAIETRAKAAILTDVYDIDANQTREISFETLSHDNHDLKKIYDSYFDEKSLTENSSANIKLDGHLGKTGGILDLMMDQLNLNSFWETLFNNILKIDLKSPAFKKQINDYLNMAQSILGFSTSEFVKNLPVLLTKIPDNLFDGIPSWSIKPLGNVVQQLINDFAPQQVVEPILDGLVEGTDLTRLEDATISQVFDAFFANLTNFVGSGLNAEFAEFADQNVSFDDLGKFWFDNKTNLANFKFETNLAKTVKNFLSTLGIFNLLLSVYKTVDTTYAADEHLFNNQQTNDLFVKELQEKTLSSFNFDLTTFNFGALASNLIYFFGQDHQQQSFQKFMYAWLYNGDNDNLPSFWKFNFALIKADENSAQPTVKKGISAKLNDLYQQTIGPKLLQPILNNLALQEIVKEENAAFASIIDENELPGLKTFFDSLTTTLGQKPMDVIYSGNLTPIVESTAELAGQAWTTNFQNGIKTVIGDQDLNVMNLMNTSLNKILGLTMVPGFPTNDLGLVPDYAGFYTNSSLARLVRELGVSFDMTGQETHEVLANHTFDFTTVKNLLMNLFYDNKIHQNKGFIADAIDNLVRKESLLTTLGYVENNLDQVKQDSTLGQLMLLFVPELKSITGEVYNLKNDLTNKRDNFNWLISGILDVISKIMRPTFYTDLIENNLFDDKKFFFTLKNERTFPKTGNIQRKEYIIIYSLSLTNVGVSEQLLRNQTNITYRLTFEKENEVGKYLITTFTKD